jgi:hypothetical protein
VAAKNCFLHFNMKHSIQYFEIWLDDRNLVKFNFNGSVSSEEPVHLSHGPDEQHRHDEPEPCGDDLRKVPHDLVAVVGIA